MARVKHVKTIRQKRTVPMTSDVDKIVKIRTVKEDNDDNLSENAPKRRKTSISTTAEENTEENAEEKDDDLITTVFVDGYESVVKSCLVIFLCPNNYSLMSRFNLATMKPAYREVFREMVSDGGIDSKSSERVQVMSRQIFEVLKLQPFRDDLSMPFITLFDNVTSTHTLEYFF
jgi:hypothetical protein